MIPILDFGNGFVVDLTAEPWRSQGCRWAIAAISGGGKSTLARVMLEELHKIGQPFLVIDPKRGEYRGLVELPGVLLAGKDGHIKINYPKVDWVHQVIDFVMKGAGVVCNLSHLASLSDQRVAYTWLMQSLWVRQVSLPVERVVPLFVVIDEADIFAPQKRQQDVESLEITNQLARRGRSFGINMIVMTQRPNDLEKDILTQFNMQLIGYLQYENDFKAVESLLNIGQQNNGSSRAGRVPPGLPPQPRRVAERIEHRHVLGLTTGEFFAVYGGRVWKLPPCRQPKTADLAKTPAIRARQRPLFALEEVRAAQPVEVRVVGSLGAAYEE